LSQCKSISNRPTRFLIKRQYHTRVVFKSTIYRGVQNHKRRNAPTLRQFLTSLKGGHEVQYAKKRRKLFLNTFYDASGDARLPEAKEILDLFKESRPPDILQVEEENVKKIRKDYELRNKDKDDKKNAKRQARLERRNERREERKKVREEKGLDEQKVMEEGEEGEDGVEEEDIEDDIQEDKQLSQKDNTKNKKEEKKKGEESNKKEEKKKGDESNKKDEKKKGEEGNKKEEKKKRR